MSDDAKATITITKVELDNMVKNLAQSSTESSVFSCVAAAFDSYASIIETATVDTASPSARAGAEVALRTAAHEARELASYMRQEAEQDV